MLLMKRKLIMASQEQAAIKCWLVIFAFSSPHVSIWNLPAKPQQNSVHLHDQQINLSADKVSSVSCPLLVSGYSLRALSWFSTPPPTSPYTSSVTFWQVILLFLFKLHFHRVEVDIICIVRKPQMHSHLADIFILLMAFHLTWIWFQFPVFRLCGEVKRHKGEWMCRGSDDFHLFSDSFHKIYIRIYM